MAYCQEWAGLSLHQVAEVKKMPPDMPLDSRQFFSWGSPPSSVQSWQLRSSIVHILGNVVFISLYCGYLLGLCSFRYMMISLKWKHLKHLSLHPTDIWLCCPCLENMFTWENTLRNGQLYAEPTFILQISVQQPIIEHLTLHGLCPAWVVGIIWSQNP